MICANIRCLNEIPEYRSKKILQEGSKYRFYSRIERLKQRRDLYLERNYKKNFRFGELFEN